MPKKKPIPSLTKKLKSKIEALPLKPGVYLFKDEHDEIIYIGKANKLRSRVRSYFRDDPKASSKTQTLVKRIADIEYIVVRGEVEALVLENNLIKKHRPRYNIRLRDDKTYQYVKITKEDFPQVIMTRKLEQDGAKYFGPFTNGSAIKHTMNLIQKVFPYRKCKHAFYNQPGKDRNPQDIRPCVQFQIGRCIAICEDDVPWQEHSEIISQVQLFLEGKELQIVKMLEEKMEQASVDMDFEMAAKLRDQINEIENILERQQAVMTDQIDRDVFGIAVFGSKAVVILLKVRQGILIGTEKFRAESTEVGNEAALDVLERILLDYYEKATDIPQEILISEQIESGVVLGQLLAELREQKGLRATKVKVASPQRGEKRHLVQLAVENAKQALEELMELHLSKQQRLTKAMKELEESLFLGSKPKRIECYDISHLGGKETVGSMVVFIDGVPKNNQYRRFKIQSAQGGDDYAAMQEVIKRRLSKLNVDDLQLVKAKKSDWEQIEAVLKENKLDLQAAEYKQFLVLKDGERLIGCIRLKEITVEDKDKSKSSAAANQEIQYEVGSLWIDPLYRGRKYGYRLIAALLSKTQHKTVYGMCRQDMVPYYEGFGFKVVKKIPQLFKEKMKYCTTQFGHIALMRYDKKKKKEDLSFVQVPDLIVLDGGKGQLSSVVRTMKELGAVTEQTGSSWEGFRIKVVALAKEQEQVYVPWDSEPIELASDSQGSFLLQRVRDEAHRFALSYQKKRRELNLLA